jgi:hypothetical protein
MPINGRDAGMRRGGPVHRSVLGALAIVPVLASGCFSVLAAIGVPVAVVVFGSCGLTLGRFGRERSFRGITVRHRPSGNGARRR